MGSKPKARKHDSLLTVHNRVMDLQKRVEDLENAMNQVCPFAWQRVSTPAQSAEKPAPLSTSWSVNDSKPKGKVEKVIMQGFKCGAGMCFARKTPCKNQKDCRRVVVMEAKT